ncbi:hypothetical protein FA95DRAFT_1593926 [Auriscalpium vulgare]|uniref:Uncharacterized protein n=1 Tax=Auriscalpium vulgare TaxID=40419 RepID=A0ACB8S2I2_9AGAM|nr:hypothetical protein FA95DRAFT_1593926 [Auriscalpium vulgare]
MEAVHAKLLPANRRLVDQYDSWVWAAVHLLSATVKNDKAGPHQDKFAKYVEAEENRLRENLKAVDYFIDESNTLTLIAGNGRIEKEIMKIGTRKIISPREFIEAGISIVHVSNALRFRTRDLRNIFAQQKLDVAKHFESFACGVLS